MERQAPSRASGGSGRRTIQEFLGHEDVATTRLLTSNDPLPLGTLFDVGRPAT